jgi:hypothetical protein
MFGFGEKLDTALPIFGFSRIILPFWIYLDNCSRKFLKKDKFEG